MILSMLKSLGRSIFTFFARPAPTSVALMAGPRPGLAANDDQSQMLRRAMQAATAAEDARDDGAGETVQNFEPISIDEVDDSAAAQAAVFAPAKPVPAAAANDAVTHDAVAQPAFETVVAAPIELADWVEVEIDEHAAAEAEFVLHAFEASLADIGELVREESEVSVFDEPVLEVAAAVVADEPVTIAAEPVVSEVALIDEPTVDEPVADPALEAAVEMVVEETADETVVEAVAEETAREDTDVMDEASGEDPAVLTDEVVAAVADDVVEKKARKKKAPTKKKAAVKSRKAKAADDVGAEPVPADDVWVSDAVAWSLSGEWSDEARVPAESSDCPRRLEELREAAAEGRLTIWGRTSDAGTWQPIEASYWKSGTVAPASLAEGRENVVAEPKTKGKAKAARKYSALKVSRAQVEELWQPDAMH